MIFSRKKFVLNFLYKRESRRIKICDNLIGNFMKCEIWSFMHCVQGNAYWNAYCERGLKYFSDTFSFLEWEIEQIFVTSLQGFQWKKWFFIVMKSLMCSYKDQLFLCVWTQQNITEVRQVKKKGWNERKWKRERCIYMHFFLLSWQMLFVLGNIFHS